MIISDPYGASFGDQELQALSRGTATPTFKVYIGPTILLRLDDRQSSTSALAYLRQAAPRAPFMMVHAETRMIVCSPPGC